MANSSLRIVRGPLGHLLRFLLMTSCALLLAAVTPAHPHPEHPHAIQSGGSDTSEHVPERAPDKNTVSSEVQGRNYYLMDAGYSCKSNTPEKTIIRSWKNRLEMDGSDVRIWGDLCSDNAEIIAFDSAKFKLSKNLKTIIFGGDTFTYYGYPPKLCDKGQWCPFE